MSWEELYQLARAGDVPALEAYLAEHKELEPEEPNRGLTRFGLRLQGIVPTNLPMLEALAAHFPLSPQEERKLAARMANLGELDALAALSPPAAAYGALRAHDRERLAMALGRMDSARAMWSVFLMATTNPRRRDFFAAKLIAEYLHESFSTSSLMWDKALEIATENYDGTLGLAGLVRTALDYGGRLAPERVDRVLRQILASVNWSNLGPDDHQLLLKLYNVGYGAWIPSRLQDVILRDEGHWVLLRHPEFWDQTARELARTAERKRDQITRVLVAVVGTNLTRYLLQAL